MYTDKEIVKFEIDVIAFTYLLPRDTASEVLCNDGMWALVTEDEIERFGKITGQLDLAEHYNWEYGISKS